MTTETAQPATEAGRTLRNWLLSIYDSQNGFDASDAILAIEHEAAVLPDLTLDVERLALAVRQVFGGRPPGWEVPPTAPYQQRADSAFRHLAHDIAAAYAKVNEGEAA